jgi:HD superfamily phosphohydrolase
MSHSKGVSDPIHGTIRVSEVEARVISTRAFQRLRNVRQLGLAYMVFPGADYSRFSHSLGVCHVTGRILSALKAAGVSFDPAEEQRYRLAGLLHDVGHYPYSHAMEHAIHDYAASQLTEDSTTTASAASASTEDEGVDDTTWLNHESVGKEVLRSSDELSTVLNQAGFTPEEIFTIFAREEPPRFANLISSDLDADRIDYLLRTAHHTGLPYGAVDLDYLLSHMRVDDAQHICLDPKALRTVDHFLLGRYFDYQQVAFHKTVAALEWVLKDVLRALLQERLLACSASDVRRMIQSGEWPSFDDARVLHLIRELESQSAVMTTRLKADAILRRRPPKLVAHVEYLDGRDQAQVKALMMQKRLIHEHIPTWSNKFGIEPALWHVWEGALTFTKVGANVPISALAQDVPGAMVDPDKTEQAVRILDPRTHTSKPIMAERRSLMSVLADRALYALRVYVILPNDRERDRRAIESHIRRDLPDSDWL